MFNEKLIDLIYKSKFAEWKITKWLIIYLLMPLTIVYIWFISLWTMIELPFLDYDKIEQVSSILLWFFWMIFLLFIISLAIQWKTIIELEKNELLTEVKKYLEKIYSKEKLDNFWYINFKTDETKRDTKIIFKKDDFKINLWLWNDEYWKIYLWTKNEEIFNRFQKYFEKSNEWKNNSYPYKGEINSLDDMKNQLDKIIKLIDTK